MSEYKPYVPVDRPMKELTLPAILLGVLMSMILGAANAYLGLKAGMTVAATFPAAVIAMAVLKLFRGTILEENLARTTGAVGEALAAGAIFTIPAFIVSGVWAKFNYLQATALLLVGGVLGVLFVILLRRTFMEDASLPFPESQACTEIVKAGQGGNSGAGMVFGAMGLSALIEIFRNGNGIPFLGSSHKVAAGVGKAVLPIQTPASSPAFLGVGFIIGPKLGAITLSGGVFGWLFLMPILIFINVMGGTELGQKICEITSAKGDVAPALFPVLKGVYNANVKIIAIGAMIVGAFFTLFKMRNNLIIGMKRSFASLSGGGSDASVERPHQDMNFRTVLIAIAGTVAAMFAVYFWLTKSPLIALVTTLVMVVAGFVFAAVAGYLVSIIGSSSNPISGLTLSTLLLAAGLLVLLGMKGQSGIAAVLGVATVVCCVAGVAGDMIQDWRVGYNLGATPWKMQVGGLIGVVAAALVLVPVLWLLHTYGGGIGSDALPAPQAGLMAEMSKGIIGGTMEWGLIVIGMLFAVALILIGAPSPMLIAVGMYLPFDTVSAIFIGGLIAWVVGVFVKRAAKDDKDTRERVENRGLLIASGLVAGEALVGILLAALVAAKLKLYAAPAEAADLVKQGYKVFYKIPSWFGHWSTALLVIVGLGAFITYFSLQALKAPAATSSEEKGSDE